MTEQKRHHVFDGIEEDDNDLPRWWVALFIVTIIFSAGYLAWYHSGLFNAPTLADEYAAEQAASKAAAAKSFNADSFDFHTSSKDAAVVAGGKEAFSTTCSPCHGMNGQGVVGPNLTDDFWINGATTAAVEKVILDGRLEKGMPAWGEILGRDKIRQIVAYLLTLQGTNPAEAKAPQGDPGHLQ